FGADEVALSTGERRLLHMKGYGHAIDTGDHGFLHGDREAFVALLGDGDGFKLHFEPTVDPVCRAVVLAVGKPRELDAAPHVDGIDRGSCELLHAGVAAREHGGGNDRHAAADHVDGNYVKALPFI